MSSMEQKINALHRAVQTSPEYADIVPLFVGIYDFLHGRENQTGIAVDLPNGYPAEKSEKGIPLLAFSDLKVDREQTVAFLHGIIEVLIQKGQDNAEYLRHIGSALQEGTIEPSVLYAASLERHRAPINEVADMLAVPAPLVVLFTGFHPKDLEAKIVSEGGVVADTFSKKLNMLVIKDSSVTNEKVKKAKALFISQISAYFLII